MSEVERRETTVVQGHPYRFQTNTYAPVTETDRHTGRKTCGKGRFSVEIMAYMNGVGMDMVDPFNSGNELLVAFRDFVKMNELLGYEHVGASADTITKMIETMWNT